MTKLPVLDWAHAAYEAARRRDLDAEIGALTELVREGRGAVDVALRSWCDRTLMVMHCVLQQQNARMVLQLDMEMEDYDSGETTTIDNAPTEQAWAARMFRAHAQHDHDTWNTLWATLPANPDVITDHVLALLHAMAATAEMYAQDNQPELACCQIHADPILAATRAAMAHYN